MFGYVVPLRGELKVKELDFYKSVYCGVCKTTGKKYGVLTRMFLSYDIVFMALVLMGCNLGETNISRHRCVFNPLKKELFCESGDIEYCSGISVLMVYYKILDDIKDSKFFKSLLYRALRLIILTGYNKAKKDSPTADEMIKNSVSALDKIEKQKSDNMDMAASTFYDMLASVGSQGIKDEKNRRIGYEIFKNAGRWIYILDAYNDIEKDLKEDSYNPLVLRYKFAPDNESSDEFKQRIKSEVEYTLNQCLYNLKGAYELLPQDDDSEVLKNIVYLGLPQKQCEVIYQKGRKEDGSV